MAEFKHLVLVKFKEGVKVNEILKAIERLAYEVDAVNSFEWGEDNESPEKLRRGLTHALLISFKGKEEYTSYLGHPKHMEFLSMFAGAVDKIVLLDFPIILAKSRL